MLIAFVALGLCNSCSSNKKITASGNQITIIPRSGWTVNEPRAYKQHVPVRITVHHEGTRLEVTDDVAKKIKAIQVWGMGKDRNWTDVPYHF